jgi:serine/threonine-protein kinase
VSTHLSAEEWARVNALFHAALDRPAAERLAWVERECDHASIVEEVKSLLAAHARAGEFIERPAGSAGRLLDDALEGGHHEPGESVGPYRIVKLLGEGGMGVVYLAEDSRLGRTVALKSLPRRFVDDETRRERLKREARAAASLTHPGIATVYALEDVDGETFIASEYVPGETLRDEISRGPLPIGRAIQTALALAEALAAAHERGIVHRDLKPENVIRHPSGTIKILDFGLARFRDAEHTTLHLSREGMVLGTPAYMSPEQIRAEDVDARSDLFALGVMLHEMVSGRHPFGHADAATTMAAILGAEPARLSSDPRADPAVVSAIETITTRCLRKAREERYASAREMVSVLEAVQSGAGVPAAMAHPSAPAADGPLWWWRFHQAAVTTGYGALVALLWHAREIAPGPIMLGLLLAGLVGAIAAGALRLHLWFASRHYSDEAWALLRPSAGFIRAADVLFVLALFAAGAITVSDHNYVGAALIGSAVAALIGFAVIEPATARAAFPSTSRRSGI